MVLRSEALSTSLNLARPPPRSIETYLDRRRKTFLLVSFFQQPSTRLVTARYLKIYESLISRAIINRRFRKIIRN